MIFSTSCEYSLRALAHLALYGGERPLHAKEIAAVEELPAQFLAKVLNRLAEAGIVEARRGRGGGFRLAKPADDVFLMDVVRALDGPDSLSRRCVLGLDECRDDQPCPLHDACKGPKRSLLDTMGRLTLGSLGAALRRKREMRSGRFPAPRAR